MIDAAIIRRIWGFPDGHIPAVHREPFWDEVPTNFRAACLEPNVPVPVTERREVPDRLWGHSPFYRLVMCGEALVRAVFDPMLHYSLVGGRYVYASGATILLVEKRRDGEIVASPWSNDESSGVAIKRLTQVRKMAPPRLNAKELWVARNMLPRCTAAISVVCGFGIQNPGTNILASGGECPIAITIGAETIHFALDHRIFDPEAAGVLYDRFFSALGAKR